MFEIASALLALVLLTTIAFPHLFNGLKKEKEKRLGATYWGAYNGTPTYDVHEHRVVAPKPGRRQSVVAGSHMYAGTKSK